MRRLLIPCFAASAMALLDCGAPGDLRDPTCSSTTFNVEGRTFVSFGSSADARKVDAFLRATIDLNASINDLSGAVLTACTAIGTDLGIASSEYRPMTSGELPVVYTCRRVGQEVRTIIQQSLPQNARLTLTYTPPVCRVDVNFAASCSAQCTGRANVEVPRCEGEVVADCSGSCTGSCNGTCEGSCTGSCNGTCRGTCMGNCVGMCAGTCSAMDSQGRCVGTCSGMCTGSCSAQCMGGCEGSCSAGCSGSCRGSCRGMCSVASNVRCDGRYNVDAEVNCRAACQAQANARAECTPPALTVAASGTPTAAQVARLNTLVRTLQQNYPAILAAAAKGQTVLTQTAPAFANSINGAASAATNVGATAVACFTRAAIVSAEAATKFQATVNVTVEFNASVTATGTVQ